MRPMGELMVPSTSYCFSAIPTVMNHLLIRMDRSGESGPLPQHDARAHFEKEFDIEGGRPRILRRCDVKTTTDTSSLAYNSGTHEVVIHQAITRPLHGVGHQRVEMKKQTNAGSRDQCARQQLGKQRVQLCQSKDACQV